MGLRIIYGKSGSGKSSQIYNEINQKIKNKENKKIYIITPEQFSFTAEQKLMEGKKSIIGAEVISFNRLAYRVINEIGGNINTQLTKCGKAMLVYSIMQKEKRKLTFLSKNDENIELCIRIISELKKHAISVEALKQIKIENQYLKNKLNDIIIIYENFQNAIKDNYIDETDLLTILAENIEKVDFLKNSIVYIDEFAGFTEQEYQTIKKIIQIAESVTITICADNLDLSMDTNIDVFYPNKNTYKKIINLLYKSEKPELIEIKDLPRFKNEELKYIEKYLYNAKISQCKTNENIELFLAKNYYSEIENVANQINKLIRKEKIRYQDISIITKNIENYSSIAKAVFEKYQIPVFIDEKRDVNQNIVIQYVLAIIEILNKNFTYESIFNYLKTGFVDIEEDDIFKFEKYVIKYGIKNNKFKNDFIYGKEEADTVYLNEIRKKIITPLEDLKNKIGKEKTAENISKELYTFLIEQNIEKKLNEKINKLNENGLEELAKEYEESYKIIIDILDEINLIFGNEKITIDRYINILKIGLKNSGLGKIPTLQDHVIIGDIDRSRSRKTKVVFILGLNDGVFPSVNKSQGFLDDEDRENLKENGVELAKGTLENLYDENFNIYKAFTIAEEKLYLSYASSDSNSNSLRASNLLVRIKKIFPNLKEKSDVISEENEIDIVNEQITYENLIIEINKLLKSDDKALNSILKYYLENPKYKQLLKEHIKYINYNYNENIEKENLEKLYGNTLNTSISRLERYNSCPFSYYLQYILNLKETEELKVQSLDTGIFMHNVIHEFFEETTSLEIKLEEITDEQIEEIVDKIIKEKLLEKGNYIFTATEKYKLLVQRLKRIIIKSLKYIILTLVQSRFKLVGTEVEFGKNGKYEPITLKLENGKNIEITGQIDRLDIAIDDDKKYVRIIDYKSTTKDLDYGNVYAGLQLQLITYLDAVCNLEDLIPAGILYFNLLEQFATTSKKINKEEIENEIKKQFKMKGLILSDVNVVRMQDTSLENGKSEIIPAYIDTKNNLSESRSSIATKEEFEKLQKYINKTIKEISKEILKGNIELKPYYYDKKTPCELCGYKKMCGFNSGVIKKKYKYVNKLSKSDFMEKIGG